MEGLPPLAQPDAADGLARNAEHYTGLIASALGSAREILGVEVDPSSEADRNSLERDIAPATEHVLRIKNLPLIRRLAKLSVDGDDRRETLTSLVEIDRQASILSEMPSIPDRARWLRLYSRVSSWMRVHDHEGDTCPVCARSLEGRLIRSAEVLSGMPSRRPTATGASLRLALFLRNALPLRLGHSNLFPGT